LFFDLPPSYDELKPPENVPVTDSAETLGPPPSYPSESLRTEGNGEPAGTVNEGKSAASTHVVWVKAHMLEIVNFHYFIQVVCW